MAGVINNSLSDSNPRNGQRDMLKSISEDEFYSDESGSSHEDSDDHCRENVEFQEEVGMTVDSENLQSCLDFISLFFTKEIWQFLVEQTNLYEEQKRGP